MPRFRKINVLIIITIFFCFFNKIYSQSNTYKNSIFVEYGYSKLLGNQFLSIPELADNTFYESGIGLSFGVFGEGNLGQKKKAINDIIGLSFNFSSFNLNKDYLIDNIQNKYPNYQWSIPDNSQFQNAQLNFDLGLSLNYKNLVFLDLYFNLPLFGFCTIQKIELSGNSTTHSAKIEVERYGFESLFYLKMLDYLSLNSRLRFKFNRIGAFISISPYFLFANKTIRIKYSIDNNEWESKVDKFFFNSFYSVKCGVTFNF